MIKINNISNFIKKYEKEIEFRVTQVEERVTRTGKTEKLIGSTHDVNKVRLGVIGELLVAYTMKGILTPEVNGIYDLTTLDITLRRIDVKSLQVRGGLTLKSISSIMGYKFYLEASQCRDGVDYVLVYVNYEEDTAIIIDSPLLTAYNIKKNYEPKLENPPNTNNGTGVNWNYLIPLRTLYLDFIERKTKTIKY